VRIQQLPGIAFSDVETTFGGSRYGARDSVRTDVVLRNEIGDVIAIYDVKTGNRGLDAGRVEELRSKTGVGASIPIIEMHVSRGVSRKALWIMRNVFLNTKASRGCSRHVHGTSRFI